VPHLIFVQPDGSRQIVQAKVGESVMRAATNANVPGILAECGGNCSCATCHCAIDSAWFSRLEDPSALEEGLLDGVLERFETSRLTCQITMRDDLDGMVVHVPES
jgi:2Fe-2S ferredoxin